jgi:predicted glycosyltransferase
LLQLAPGCPHPSVRPAIRSDPDIAIEGTYKVSVSVWHFKRGIGMPPLGLADEEDAIFRYQLQSTSFCQSYCQIGHQMRLAKS